MTTPSDLTDQLGRVAGLTEHQRRALYAYVASQQLAVSRDEAAIAVGISRPLAAYHLDRLVRDGLLETRFERRSGRSGPGAGRPAKLYFRSREAVELSVPARDYAFVAELMARALESEDSGDSRGALRQVAYEAGRAYTSPDEAREGGTSESTAADVRGALTERGYEPYDSTDGDIRLRNCPFDRLAEGHRDLVCGANLASLEGVVDQLDLGGELRPRLEPRPGECCVALGGRQCEEQQAERPA
jgi:predicted ArsR family transcriptional regulator